MVWSNGVWRNGCGLNAKTSNRRKANGSDRYVPSFFMTCPYSPKNITVLVPCQKKAPKHQKRPTKKTLNLSRQKKHLPFHPAGYETKKKARSGRSSVSPPPQLGAWGHPRLGLRPISVNHVVNPLAASELPKEAPKSNPRCSSPAAEIARRVRAGFVIARRARLALDAWQPRRQASWQPPSLSCAPPF